eukprot:190050-Rhodomonas_salina.6
MVDYEEVGCPILTCQLQISSSYRACEHNQSASTQFATTAHTQAQNPAVCGPISFLTWNIAMLEPPFYAPPVCSAASMRATSGAIIAHTFFPILSTQPSLPALRRCSAAALICAVAWRAGVDGSGQRSSHPERHRREET